MSVNTTNETFVYSSPNCWPIEYPYSFVMYGVLCPVLALTTLCTNILIIMVFTKNKMRSPTTILLTGLAISDILAGIVITPLYIYFYGMGYVSYYYHDGLSYPLCIFHSLAYKVNVVLHTVSIWLTVALGVQRYIVVAFPIPGRRLCSQKNSAVVIILVYIIVLGIYSLWFIDDRFEPRTRVNDAGLVIQYCFCSHEEIIQFDLGLIMKFIRLVFGQFLPCVILVCATVALVQKLIVESKRILTLHQDDEDEGERTDFRLIRRTTVMVVLIVISFCLVEIPLSIVFIIDLIDIHIISQESRQKAAVIFNFCVFMTYQVNFWVYVCLSRHFRDNLRKIIPCVKQKRHMSHSVNSKSYYLTRSAHSKREPSFH